MDREHHDGRLGPLLAEPGDGERALLSGEVDVEEDDVHSRPEAAETFLRASGRSRATKGRVGVEEELEALPKASVVLDDEDADGTGRAHVSRSLRPTRGAG